MARSIAASLRGSAVRSLPGALQRFEIGEILRTRRRRFVANEGLVSDERHRDGAVGPGHPGLPYFLERDAVDPGHQIDAIRRRSELKDAPGPVEIGSADP